ncbi:MAG: GNAT family N-acetyltransferase [bacterium]|nr:GNAT family N-acetyltransferase [bacterium]
MKISEIDGAEDVESLLSIVSTHTDDAEQLRPARKQLLKELGEVRTNRHFYVGLENGTVVAMIQLVLNNADNDPELANGEDIAHTHNLQVRSELQGRGIGRRMMEFVEEKAREMGKKTLTLGVDDSNERAAGLYRKLGYRLFKEEPGRVDSEKCLFMRKSV